MRFNMTVNGKDIHIEAPPLRRLLDILRQDLGLTGTKEGCGEGECGACAVIMDGMLVNSCMVPAIQLPGKDILTIEGLGSPEEPDSLQRAFVEEGAVQCGFCTPGMVMASRFLLSQNNNPGKEQIRTGLAGNLCRCTGYERIFRAVERAAEEGYGKNIEPSFFLSSPGSFELCEDEKNRIFIPHSTGEALAILKTHGKDTVILAGTTDIMVQLKNGMKEPLSVMDISRIPELSDISLEDDSLQIGSCSTYSRIYSNPIVQSHFPALEKAARLNGAITLQNRATLGGNLMTASPAADMPPVLMALDAKAVLRSTSGSREISISELWTGYRNTVRLPEEILIGIKVPIPSENSRQIFYKRGSRSMLTIARVSLAGYIGIDENGSIVEPRFAVGTMGKTAFMLEDLRNFLEGKALTEDIAIKAGNIASGSVNPRKTPEYRKQVTGNLVKKFLLDIIGERDQKEE